MNNIYNIQWLTFVRLSLPIALRQSRLMAFLMVLIKPVQQLHETFKSFRIESLYKVRHNSQIAYLENVLNDAYDSQLRRIRIANAVFKTPLFFYEPEENKEVYFYQPEDNKPVYFHEGDEFEGEGFDFNVNVPPELESSILLTQMKGLINYYKLYSKNYLIIWEAIED